MDWPVVPLADSERTISEECTEVKPRSCQELSELQGMLVEACMVCWPMESFAVSSETAVAELHHIRTSRPGAADHQVFPFAVGAGKSSHGHAVQRAAQEMHTDRSVALGAEHADGDMVLEAVRPRGHDASQHAAEEL
jgi:hypothetical protein